MADSQFKRNIAFKLRIGDTLMGKPIIDNAENFSFLEIGEKRIVRVNIVGNIVEKFEREGEKNYSFFTLDDGSGQIRLKIFGEDVKKFSGVSQGQTVVIIGVLRYWNNELYIAPEIIKEQDTRYLLVRKLELEKEKEKSTQSLGREQMVAVKDKILGTIKNAEEIGGMEIDQIIMGMPEISPTIITQEIQKLLEDGIIFEPRPGKVRYLG
ncbi:MAG: OB-fold nucleic acid binding domain-containing protein [archaeon]